MTCPHCNLNFRNFVANAAIIPDLAPLLCEKCGEISMLEKGSLRRMTCQELHVVKQSPAFRDVIEPFQRAFATHRKVVNAQYN